MTTIQYAAACYLVFAGGYFAARAFGLDPRPCVVEDRADVIELHHFYDECGKHVFSQVIAWEFVDGEHRCFHWHIRKQDEQPIYDGDRDRYYLLWLDGEQLRILVAPSRRERWTQNDVELENREVYPKRKRRGLSRVEE